MAVHFHSLRVKEIKKETPECVSILFDVPDKLEKEFQFMQGQNLTIKIKLNGEEIRRSYSICAAPYENELRVAVKKAGNGVFSSFANETLKEGDELEVLPPTGKFNTILQSDHKKTYLAFAAGSGITPIISIIKTTLQTEPQSSFTLVYGNKSRNSIVFFEELEGLKNKFMQRFNLINILSREKTDAAINFGRIDNNKLRELGKLFDYSKADEIFICGPEEMIFCAKDFLSQLRIDERKVHFELFTTPGQTRITSRNLSSAIDTQGKSRITIKLDGRSIDFELSFNNDASILDAALKEGADLPFACKGGVCCTCKAKLEEGEVVMDANWGLEHDELEKGYILTCQSHPLTERIVIDFDVR